MATISSLNAVQASWPEHNTLGGLTRRSDSGTQGVGESEKSSRVVILAGPGGVGTIRLELEFGPRQDGSPGVGDVCLVELAPRRTSRPPWRTLRISSMAGAA